MQFMEQKSLSIAQFIEAEFKTHDPPHLKQILEKARENLKNYYTTKEIMEVKMTCYKVKHEIDSINYEKMVAGWAKMNFNPDCWYRSTASNSRTIPIVAIPARNPGRT
jgi:hypothetical protein